MARTLRSGWRIRLIARGDEVYNSFRGLVDYVKSSEPIQTLLANYPHWRLYGEWLVKHTVSYPKEHRGKLYVFDVYDHNKGRYLHYEEYAEVLNFWGVLYVPAHGESRETEGMQEWLGYMMGYSLYGASPASEGIVIKNYDFVNKFGGCVYAKMVTKDSREANKVARKLSPKGDVESRITANYLTAARVRKIVEKCNLREMSDIPQLFGCVYHDTITEDMWDILKKYKNPTIDFRKPKKYIETAAKNHYVDMIREIGRRAHD